MDYELSAEVEQYVEPFAVADEFVMPEPAYEFPWLDGATEVPEGYLWPEQVAEMEAQAAFDAFVFTEEYAAECMAAIGGHGAIEIPEFSLVGEITDAV